MLIPRPCTRPKHITPEKQITHLNNGLNGHVSKLVTPKAKKNLKIMLDIITINIMCIETAVSSPHIFNGYTPENLASN